MDSVEFFGYLIVFSAILTYLVLGLIIGIESMLALYGVPSAKEWIRRWYTPAGFRRALIIFLPMLQLAYLFLELIPSLFGMDGERRPLDLERIYSGVFGRDGKERE
ncbi:MAG: hypothetical protein GXO19_01675 [Epsilonproteobacteria bacterium]|nr:hypothetical protein [Campylobacterota bacterium]NPA56425.1 hypothetical protein [Campylobacterota bacterium]